MSSMSTLSMPALISIAPPGGKFLGRWGPASKCACCCGKKLNLTQALWLLAGIQLATGVGAAYGAIRGADLSANASR